MKFIKITICLMLLSLIITSGAIASEPQFRQISITGDTTADEFISSLNWLNMTPGGSQSNKFHHIINTVANTYYYGITQDELLSSVVNGQFLRLYNHDTDFIYSSMFDCLDKFSYYIPPMFNSMVEEPHYTGYGFVIYDTNRNKYVNKEPGLFLEEIYEDSPAEKAGFLPDDKVIYVNDIKVENLPLNAISSLLSSYDDNQECTLTVERNGELYEATMKKEFILSKELMETYYPEYSTVKLDITAFNSSALETQFKEAVSNAYKMGYKNLIIDLRNNSGGVVDYTMKIADFLITKKHQLFSFYTKDDQLYMNYESDRDGYKFRKVYVLVNAQTASSAEALTIALKDLAGAVVVGQKTYGKQVGQIVYPLEDNSIFAITTIKGYGPENEDYNNVGIVPDHTVENKTYTVEPPADFLPLTAEQLPLICPDGDREAILALEQRYMLLTHLPEENVDGIYDQNLDSCIKITQVMRGSDETELTEGFLQYIDKHLEDMTGSIRASEDTQLDFVMNLIKPKR
ncbi:MAG: PDZ domain-containing protein [Clostridia bacterium]|nr:PDZ domain-containing protein [Clostridia bacterium]